MLKSVICLVLIALAVAAPETPKESESKKEPVPILRSESKTEPDGSYNFVYEAGDGTFREETGDLVNSGAENEGFKITGSYKYIDANGEEVVVTYTADENGFIPVGTHIPKQISDNALAARNLPKHEPKVKATSPGH